MENLKIVVRKLLFGALFILVIPAILVLWAWFTAHLITVPIPHSLIAGYIILGAGIFFIASGMLNLIISGKGLPMNPFPPRFLVTKGVYAFTRHPIYLGAALISFGISLIFSSSAGFWLVSPVLILLMAAYVAGYENEKTEANFGTFSYKTFLTLPPADDQKPSACEKFAACILVFIPWGLTYQAFIVAGFPRDAISTNLPFEKNIPVWEFMEYVYSLAYILTFTIPIVIRKRKYLRAFITDLWLATIITGIIYFAFPFVVTQRVFEPQTLGGKLLLQERALDAPTCALPSCHVIWVFIAAWYFTATFKKTGILWYSLAILITLSCIMTGNHSIPDIIAGFLVFLVVINKQKIWNSIRLVSEKFANSWKEWRIGPARLINHGLYGGLAGMAGAMISGFFLGKEYAWVAFVVLIFVIIGAGLWAQIIEGSPKLLRPYGYYGGLIGGILASIAASLAFGVNLVILLGAFAMAGPWIQALGRLRCLIQGCCHGKPSDAAIGIHFVHPLSRVNKISGLKGLPLHPTQLYSIANNIVAGMILLRLCSLGMPAIFIIGMYFILNGAGRFVEESFRGEAQTPYWHGMRIYQWVAVVNIAAGIVCTCLPLQYKLTFQLNFASLIYGIVMGILVTIASGVDFPGSNKRFARLTSN
jgi:protein-S-isoprenylcysteine O-methyltransferase Ste14